MASKAKPTSLLDDVRKRVVRRKPGFPSWFEKLPAEAIAELEAVRQAFDPTVDEKKAYAKAIIASLTERGWPVSGTEAVCRWLNARP